MVGRAVAVALAGAVLAGVARPAPAIWADADDHALVSRGRQVYAARCASCHGRALEGQPLWRLRDADQPRRAPAQDGSGPGWQHSDAQLFAAVSAGAFPGEARSPRSRMPAFGALMPVGDIVAVLAFVKARWPLALRVAQAALDPGQPQPRLPSGAWRFPAECMPR